MNDYRETSNNGDDYKPYINPGVSAQYNLNCGKENLINHFSLGADYEAETMSEHEFAVPDEYHRDSTRGDSHFGQLSFDLNSILINQIIRERSLGIFFIDKLDISKKLFATLNVRNDYMYSELIDDIPTPDSLCPNGNKIFQKTTYRFGLAYDVCKSTNIYANYGTGFLVPTNDELYNNPVAWGGFNSTIKPSTSQGGEFGIRGNVGNKINYDVTGFMINSKNEFYRYSVPGRGNNTAFYGNMGASNRSGLEAFLSYSPVKSVRLEVAYTYSHFIYTSPDSVKNHWIPECPQHMLTAEVGIKLTKNFTLTLSTEYESKWKLQVDDSIYNYYTIGQTYYQTYQKCSSWVTAPGHNYGYNIYSAEINYHWKLGSLNGDLSLYAKNIFGQHYYGFTEPNNGVDYNSYQPAPGREFFVSLKVRF
jgi:iron complex outermembrane receptor protein